MSAALGELPHVLRDDLLVAQLPHEQMLGAAKLKIELEVEAARPGEQRSRSGGESATAPCCGRDSTVSTL